MGIGNTQVQHFVEATGTKECLIEQIRSVGCADDEDTFSSITHTVELGQQLTDDSIHDTTTVTLVSTLRRD